MKKYQAIINYIKSEISNGSIKSGKKLPSIRNICEEFQCSKVTVVKAYDLLEKEHIIYSIPKSGYYLIENNLNLNNKICNKYIDFSTSAPDSRILPYEEFQHCLNQAMDLYKERLFSNSNTQGFENLINVIVKQLQDYQVFTYNKCVFITTGSQQAINILTMMHFPNGKDNVLIEQPTYHGVIKSLEINNINTIGIKRDHNGIDLNELEKMFKYNNIKFFYTVPRFHNPTGFSYSNKDKKKIIELAEKYDVYIVEDDYLADLEVDKKSDPIYALDCSSRVIYLKSYSKIILPQLRISAVVLPKLLLKTFKEYKKWNDLNTSILSQGALEIYIKSGMFNAHMKKLRTVYRERMSYLDKLIKNLNNSNVKWYIPNSGFFASFEITNNVSSKDIVRRLNMKNILLPDTCMFYLENHINEKLIRLSVSRVNNDEIKKGINMILKEIKDK
ncbi:PLP-dependent aminotransferase family protein [Tepidibacter hydrothermalis]|uniref:PLP-dependent aminotransferase family protein n=1 Tax=Tepidibacter hydrothermalis TaxID=3036126 RepID=A0ABY8EJG5_9FIRM|nr:PLP-dependent aminotransferase family protein [Tepidibacter hydrothermalis]WFD11113.1 PLP-dependent aminotransferase family protein [Tepidibacter hydrothermalis]